MSRSSVDHRARSAETLTLITQLKRTNEEQLRKLYGMVLNEAGKDLTKRSLDARIRTRDQVIRIIQAGDPRLDPIPGGGENPRAGEFTLEELLVSYHRQTVATTKKARV